MEKYYTTLIKQKNSYIASTQNMSLNQLMVLIQYQIFKTTSTIYIYVIRITNTLVLHKKDGYKLELQTPEIMKLFGSTQNLRKKTKHGENVPSLGMVKVVLVSCNLLDYQHRQKSEVLYTFTPN